MVHIVLQSEFADERLPEVMLDNLKAGDDLEPFAKDAPHMSSYFGIVLSPWWHRLWVVQEALLASQAVFHFGRVVIPWSLMKKFRLRILPAYVKSTEPWAPPAQKDAFLTLIIRLMTFFDLEPDPLLDVGNTKSVHRLLSHMSKREVTDAPDRVYGVIGLLPPELGIRPNYQSSVAHVYRDFTLRVMKNLKTLNLLSFSGHPAEALDFGPSWVPRLEYQGIEESPHWNADRGASCYVVERDTRSLVVRAHLVGEISTVESACQTASYASSDPEFEEDIVEVEEVRQRLAVWRSLIPSSDENADLCRLRCFQFWRTILGYTYESSTPSIYQKLDPYTKLEELDAWLENASIELSPEIKVLTETVSIPKRFTFFVLGSGLMGLSNMTIAAGDVVAIIAGCDQPLTLKPRQESNNTYAVGAPCNFPGAKSGTYIHYVASQAVKRVPRSGLWKPEFDDFVSAIKKWHYAYNAVDLWTRDLTRAKAMLKHLINKNLQLSSASDFTKESVEQISYQEEVIEMVGVIFSIWDRMTFVRRPTVSTLDALLLFDHLEVFWFANYLIIAFLCVMEAWEEAPPSSVQYESSQYDQDVHDLATRLGLLIYEGFIRLEAVKIPGRVTSETGPALFAFSKGYQHALDSLPDGEGTTKWLYALQVATQDHIHVERNVDVVFKDIVLV